MKNFGRNAVNKGLPAGAGGIGSKLITKKIVPMISSKIPTTWNPTLTKVLGVGLDLSPAIAGLFLLNDKDDGWSYAGAGAIGASLADSAQTTFPEFLSDKQSVLADQVDVILEKARKAAMAKN